MFDCIMVKVLNKAIKENIKHLQSIKWSYTVPDYYNNKKDLYLQLIKGLKSKNNQNSIHSLVDNATFETDSHEKAELLAKEFQNNYTND